LQIRGEGLVLGIEFIANKETKESFPASWGKTIDHSLLILGWCLWILALQNHGINW